MTDQLKFDILKTTVTATQRKLSASWRLIWPRESMPMHVRLKDFPHSCVTPRDVEFDQVAHWCHAHVGQLDAAWTYKDTGLICFKQQTDAVQFRLTFG